MPSRLGHSLGVFLGQGVFRLHCGGQRKDHLLRTVEGVVEGFEPQRRPDTGDQLDPLDWLRHEVVCSRLQRPHAIVGLVQRGDHHHRQQPAAWRGFDAAADFITVEARHLDVEKNEVGGLGLDLFEGGFAVLRHPNLAIDSGQVCLDELAVGSTVVNYEYDRHVMAAWREGLLSVARSRNCSP